ncbi:protein MIS12 homolog [Pieris rapae]|uniref:protein MIS12 homolog n=1 Tax=Pieris rapae TaxID=64459 RepID=UPI000B9274ED|nr:protein MIS12 homolog [Pieris rapae]
MIKTEKWSGGTEEEYETQHFGFGSQRLKIAVREMVEDKIRASVTKAFYGVHNTLGLNETDEVLLAHTREKLIRLYCNKASAPLDVIDTEIEKMLKIPPNVLLPEDDEQSKQISETEYNLLNEEVNNLKKKVLRGALMESWLSKEDKELSSIEDVIELTKKDMEVVDVMQQNLESPDTVKAMINTVQFLSARLPFIEIYDKLYKD